MHDRELVGELGDEDRVLHRRVAAADHGDVLALEEGAVADAAGRDAEALKLHLAGDAEPLGLGAHGEDHGAGAVGVLADDDLVDVAVGQLQLGDVVGDEAGAEALRLLAEVIHHLRPHHALGVAGIVLDVGRVLELAAPLEALDHERLQLGAGGVESSGIAGGAAADDDQFLHLLVAHALPFGGYLGPLPDPHFTLYSTRTRQAVELAVWGSTDSLVVGASLPSSSQRLTVLRSWKKAMMPGGIGSQKAITR